MADRGIYDMPADLLRVVEESTAGWPTSNWRWCPLRGSVPLRRQAPEVEVLIRRARFVGETPAD